MIKINVIEITIKATDNRHRIEHINGVNKVSHKIAKELKDEMPKQECSCGRNTIVTIDSEDHKKNFVYCCDIFKNYYLQSYDTDPYEWEMVRGNTQDELDNIVKDYMKKGWTDEDIYASTTIATIGKPLKEGAYKKLLKKLKENNIIVKNGNKLYEDASTPSKRAIIIKENLILNNTIYNISNPLIQVSTTNGIDLIKYNGINFNIKIHGNLEGDYYEIISIA